jgi:hypothetical protein
MGILFGSNRDSVVATQIYRDESNKFMCYSTTSVEDPLVPVDPQRVRIDLKLAGWVIRPDPTCPDGSRLRLTYIVHVDVGGQVPQSISRMVLRDLPSCVAGVIRYMKRHTFPPHLVPQLEPPRRHALAKPLPPKSPRRPSPRPWNGIRVLHEAFEHRLASFDLSYRVEFDQGTDTPCNRADLVIAEIRLPRPLYANSGISVDVRPTDRVAWQLIDERTGQVVEEGGQPSETIIRVACDRLAQISLIEEEEEDEATESTGMPSMLTVMQPPSPNSPSQSPRYTPSDRSPSQRTDYFDVSSSGRTTPRSIPVPSSAFGRTIMRRRVSTSSDDSWDEHSTDQRSTMSTLSPNAPLLSRHMSRSPSGSEHSTWPASATDSGICLQFTSPCSISSTSSEPAPSLRLSDGIRRRNSTSSTASRRCVSPVPVLDAHQVYETCHPGWRLVIYNDSRVNGRIVQVCIKKLQQPKQRRFGPGTWSWMQRD